MADPVRQFIDGEYGQIHIRVATPEKTTAPPLYCLHMSPKSGRYFDQFMRAASDDRIVVAPDYPGYGESAPPPATPQVTIADYARNVWRVADMLGHDVVDLFGVHTGSEVAVEMAHQAPARVRRIVISSAPVFTDQELRDFIEYFQPAPLDEEGTRFRTMWERIKEHRGPGMTLEMMATSLAENLRGGDNYEWGHRAAFDYAPQFRRRISELDHPITVLNPKDEMFEHTKRAAPLLKNGVVVDLPDWGHGFLDVFTDEAVKIVKDALS